MVFVMCFAVGQLPTPLLLTLFYCFFGVRECRAFLVLLIDRSQHADLIYQNKVRIENNYEIYRRRQAIVEHPYGVIKRQWDFYYIMTKKSIKHASADVGLIFTTYNLKRIFNLVDLNILKMYLKRTALFYWLNTTHLKAFYGFLNFEIKRCVFYKIRNYCSGNGLYLLQN